MKVKMFCLDNDLVEDIINKWLKDNSDIEIKFTNASEAMTRSQYSRGQSKSLYIFYEDKISFE